MLPPGPAASDVEMEIQMTFTILATCPKTGKAGFATSTSTPAVGWRPVKVVPNRGVVCIQALGDYRKLLLGQKLMEQGHLPQKILEDLSAGDPDIEYRQIAIMDFEGRSAVFTGPAVWKWCGEVVGEDHIATGNSVLDEGVVRAMSDAYAHSAGEELEVRLIKSLLAARDAGGQASGQSSAVIRVCGRREHPLVDLRIDKHPEPIGALATLFDWYRPLIPYFADAALAPPPVTFEAHLASLGQPARPAHF